MATAPRASDGAPAGGRTPPGPPAHPLWGHARESGRDRLGFRLALAARYGDVARYRLGPVTLYQVSHPEHIARVLQDNARNYDKNTVGFRLLRPVLGDGLLTSDGAPWLRQRRLMQPAFHRRRIAALGATMTGAAERMLDAWGPVAARGGALDIAAAMGDLTFGIATATLFGADGGADAAAIRRAVAAIGADVAFRLDTPFYPPPRVPTPRNRRVLATRRLLDRVVDDPVARRRRAGADTDDLLALLLAARDAETGAALDDRQLRDEAITLLLAGHETTATALSWAWYLLATHPDAERRLATELAAVLAGRTPTTDDLPRHPVHADGGRGDAAALPAGLGLHPPGAGRRPARPVPHPGRRDRGHQPLRHPPAAGPLAPPGGLRARALRGRGRRPTPAALRLPAIRGRAAPVHRQRLRADRAAPGAGDGRPALPPAPGPRPAGRAGGAGDAAPARRATDAGGAALTRRPACPAGAPAATGDRRGGRAGIRRSRYQSAHAQRAPSTLFDVAARPSGLLPAWAWRAIRGRIRALTRRGKCQNSGRVTITVVIFPTWWTIAAK